MDDPECEKNWTALIRIDSESAIPYVPGRLTLQSTVPLTIGPGERVSGSGPMNVTGQVDYPPPCSGVVSPSTTTTSVGGTLRDGTFRLMLAYAPYTLTVTMRCEIPALGNVDTPVPVPMPALSEFPITVRAKSGATGSDSSGAVTVTMMSRR